MSNAFFKIMKYPTFDTLHATYQFWGHLHFKMHSGKSLHFTKWCMFVVDLNISYCLQGDNKIMKYRAQDLVLKT